MPMDFPPRERLATRTGRALTGRRVLIMFLSFFGVIAAVNVTMLTLASRTMPGLDVKNSYVASQLRNAEIAAMRAQDARGWSADVVMRLEAGHVSVSLAILDGTGKPARGLTVTAHMAHPAVIRADRSATLIEGPPGQYSGAVPDMKPGAWTALIEASRDGERLYASRNRVVLGG